MKTVKQPARRVRVTAVSGNTKAWLQALVRAGLVRKGKANGK